MKHLKTFNENIPYAVINKINLDQVDIKEICPECGAFAMRLKDSQPIYCPENWEAYGINFDNDVYANAICDNCGHTEHEIGTIKWVIRNRDKRLEYLEMYKKGVNPLEIKKYNL